MTDIVISIAAKIAELLVDPIIHRARYFFCFNKLVGDLQKAKTELEETHRDMKERTEHAIRNAEKLVRPVEKWLNDVGKVLEDVQKLEERVGESKSCLNVKLRYSLAKQVESMTQQMNKHTEDMKELMKSKISEPTELPRMEYFSSKDFMSFNSRKSTCDKLLMAIKDNKSKMVGLVGMGGSGKTTLAKEIGKQIEKLRLFDKVVMTVVSQNPNVRVIQGEIADQLSFKFKQQETELGRAQKLSQRLKTQKILIILDDVWKKLDLEATGIPLNENECKILLTTRKKQVCESMGCQITIELSLLTEEEGWRFFKHCTQIVDDSPQVLSGVAKRISNKCQGLLIAIVTVGSTLRGKTFEWWEFALAKLEKSLPIDVAEDLISPFACLKLSYDNLMNQLAKSLFLLCCMFPDDHEIHIKDLVRFGSGVLQGSSLSDFETLEIMRQEFNMAVKTLLDCCLLMLTNKNKCVKMHDMVRDVALWIASIEGQAIMVANREIPLKLKEAETIKDTIAISLWNLEPHEMPHQLICPTLKILLNHIPNEFGRHHEIAHAYLEGKKELKVLAILAFTYTLKNRDMRFWSSNVLSIPESIRSLSNVRTLCLRGYRLGDISILGSIKGMEILDLRGSSFIELPSEIAVSNKLKILDLYCCEIKKGNPYEVIAKCSLLQELYILARGDYSPENVSFSKLQRCDIWLSKAEHCYFAHPGSLFKEYGQPRFLHVNLEGSYASALSYPSVKDLLLRAEGLYLSHIPEGYKNIIPDMDKQGMNRLTFLALDSCSGIKCLIDTTTLVSTSAYSANANVIQSKVVSSKLVALWLHDMHDLEELFRDPSSSYSNLCNLMSLTIRNCPKLARALFTPSIAQTLQVLEKLDIRYCENLKYIIAEDMEEGSPNSNPKARLIEISTPALRNLYLQRLPNLISISSSTMEQVNRHVLWVVATTTGTLSQLMCDDRVLPSTLQAFLHLEYLDMNGLHKLEGIFEVQVEEEEEEEEALGLLALKKKKNKLTSNLHRLDCWYLYELRFIWNGPARILCLQRLRRISLYICPKLKTVFSATIVPCLPELEDLSVIQCKELDEIIPDLDLDLDSDSDSEELAEAGKLRRNLSSVEAPPNNSQQVCFPKLWRINIKRCDKLKCIFSSYYVASHCPSLETLYIASCPELEEVVKLEHKLEESAADNAAVDQAGVGHEQQVHGNKLNKKKQQQHDVLFPKLKDLKLQRLPNLSGIFAGYDEFKSKPNRREIIRDCPKLNNVVTFTQI